MTSCNSASKTLNALVSFSGNDVTCLAADTHTHTHTPVEVLGCTDRDNGIGVGERSEYTDSVGRVSFGAWWGRGNDGLI